MCDLRSECYEHIVSFLFFLTGLEAEETVAHLCVPTKEIADAEEPVEH
jgi:hypothetical protein